MRALLSVLLVYAIVGYLAVDGEKQCHTDTECAEMHGGNGDPQ